MFEEKLAYQLDERMRDMNDMVDSCHNRVSKSLLVLQLPTVIPFTGVSLLRRHSD